MFTLPMLMSWKHLAYWRMFLKTLCEGLSVVLAVSEDVFVLFKKS